MFGVVLWSDGSDKKAVIWCEDHGDLAYFCAGDSLEFDGGSFDPGDLVQFDLGDDAGPLRRVCNPRLVAEEQYPSLAQRLQLATERSITPPAPVLPQAPAVVIAFDGKAREKHRMAEFPQMALAT